MFNFKPKSNAQTGSITLFVLMLGIVFTITVGGIVTVSTLEYTNTNRTQSHEQALNFAEAGINYYKWHLAHDPGDYTDGTGEPGPYLHEYQLGGETGYFSLEITPPEEGSETVTVKSTGWTDQYPSIRRAVEAKFGPVTLTRYSFLHNSNVWFGTGIEVFGEVFSNGGIRMDGINRSTVASSRETYICGIETGCVHSQIRPGVWGHGGPEDLWSYPVSFFDFDSIVTDLSSMRQAAQESGLYLGPSGGYGYQLIFNSNGTVSVYRVTSARNQRGWEVERGCVNLYQEIRQQSLVGNYPLADNKIIYVEDQVWVNGEVNGQTSVVAARLPVDSYQTDIWINGNINYLERNGEHNLGLIAQNDIIFAEDIPQVFNIDAAMLAQNGRVMRHHYNYRRCAHTNKATRLELHIYGSVISNLKSYWNFSGPGGPTSGFTKREIIYNQDAANVPPPYFPNTGQIQLLSWDETDG